MRNLSYSYCTVHEAMETTVSYECGVEENKLTFDQRRRREFLSL